ncbi:MAG TPA: MFS transporter, partial [Enterococcus sp.]|nr:MFS transporter [Enterococcus sp.]
MITCIAVSMLATALTTALPAIVTDLQISVTTGQWLTSGYSLAMAIVMPLTAYLMNRVPTKKLYLAALGIALVGLLLCAAAPNFLVMMLARILQAVGNGILTAMAQVILLSIYPINRIGVVMGDRKSV